MTTIQDLDHCIGSRLGLNMVRARIKAGAFLGCVGEALPMMSYQECLDFATMPEPPSEELVLLRQLEAAYRRLHRLDQTLQVHTLLSGLNELRGRP